MKNNKISVEEKQFDRIKEVEKWLYNYKSIQASIENLREQYDILSDAGTGVDTSREAISKTYKFNSEVENLVIQLQLLSSRIKVMENRINQIDKALNILSEVEKEIIIYKYISNQNYYEFTYKVYKSERQCRRIKNNALSKIAIVLFGI